MKYCSKCGKELFDEAVICTGCGCPVESTTKPKSYAYDTVDKGLCVLSFLIPLFGFVYWLVKHNETPEKAKACAQYALAAWIVGIIAVSFGYCSML